MHPGMRSAIPPVNVEDDQKFDADLLKRLAKIVEALQNIED
jgi:outer membrane translocation and assembly module TamA